MTTYTSKDEVWAVALGTDADAARVRRGRLLRRQVDRVHLAREARDDKRLQDARAFRNTAHEEHSFGRRSVKALRHFVGRRGLDGLAGGRTAHDGDARRACAEKEKRTGAGSKAEGGSKARGGSVVEETTAAGAGEQRGTHRGGEQARCRWSDLRVNQTKHGETGEVTAHEAIVHPLLFAPRCRLAAASTQLPHIPMAKFSIMENVAMYSGADGARWPLPTTSGTVPPRRLSAAKCAAARASSPHPASPAPGGSASAHPCSPPACPSQ